MNKKSLRYYRINPINILSRILETKFRELEGLADFIESSITRELKWWEEWVKKETRGMTPEERKQFAEIYSDDYQTVDKDFRHRLRYAFIVTAHGVIESELNSACRVIKNYRIEYKKEPCLSGCLPRQRNVDRVTLPTLQDVPTPPRTAPHR